MKYYIAYKDMEPFLENKAEILYEADDLSVVEEVIEERGEKAKIYEYDVVPNSEYLDGRLVLQEYFLENGVLVE